MTRVYVYLHACLCQFAQFMPVALLLTSLNIPAYVCIFKLCSNCTVQQPKLLHHQQNSMFWCLAVCVYPAPP